MKLINVPTDRKVIVGFRDALHVLTEDELSSIIDSKVFIVKFSDILEQCVDESIIKRINEGVRAEDLISELRTNEELRRNVEELLSNLMQLLGAEIKERDKIIEHLKYCIALAILKGEIREL